MQSITEYYRVLQSIVEYYRVLKSIAKNYRVLQSRPAQLAELPHSEFGPELFPHSAYVKFFVTFATKKPYLTFWDKM